MKKAIQIADLRFFAVLAGTGKLSDAGLELGISRSAISKHLAQIEAKMGMQLVSRTTRQMRLTPEGEIYLMHAHRILDEVDRMQALLVPLSEKNANRHGGAEPSQTGADPSAAPKKAGTMLTAAR